MEIVHKKYDRDHSTVDNKYGWSVLIDSKTHKGLEILGAHFELPKKTIVRQLVAEKLRELKMDSPIKEVALSQ